MTQITKEQAHVALTGLAVLAKEHPNADALEYVRHETVVAYITQLEANQRQPVSESPQSGLRSNPQNVDSEKLREAVSRIDDEFGCATEFNRELLEIENIIRKCREVVETDGGRLAS